MTYRLLPGQLELRHIALFAWAGVLAALTLWPRQPSGVETLDLCLLCGERGLADALLNVLLFLPLGLALHRRRWWEVIGAGIAVSVGIEGLQLLIPGRHPSPADVLFNTLGALAGQGLGRLHPYWVRPNRYLGDRLATLAAILAGASLPLTAWLSEQKLPDPPYRVEWEAGRPGTIPYPGEVRTAAIGRLDLSPGPSGQGEAAERLLEQGAAIRVIVETGPPPAAPTQIFGLYDTRGRAVAFLGVDGSDLLYRERTRAAWLRLDSPVLRERGALDRIGPGQPVRVGTWRSGVERCFSAGLDVHCGHGMTGSRAWRFLMAMNGASARTVTMVSAAWLALLLLPVGYWARWPLALGLSAAFAGYAWLRAPADLPLLPVPPTELAGIAAGVLLGIALRRGYHVIRGRPHAPAAASGAADRVHVAARSDR